MMPPFGLGNGAGLQMEGRVPDEEALAAVGKGLPRDADCRGPGHCREAEPDLRSRDLSLQGPQAEISAQNGIARGTFDHSSRRDSPSRR